ncbi:hypothetical protein [Desulforhopalus singaporensis]|uniref:Uncharacterized protein n=1 Tax=Desulforhopalus singaporensis TaxID=91360 RepID=A0A1H0VCZ4_9BACT|nr:hypothetical protein [Desulforhopalus singaporensis]SDP76300.1 hypothetical protein SAMN05660330_03995 [Desulforhopalus singaporensis]
MVEKVKSAFKVNGLDEDTHRELIERINYFENNHQGDVMNCGDGWVPRLKNSNYIFSGIINIFITMWLIWALA